MTEDLQSLVEKDFAESDRPAAVEELGSITLDHVMAASQSNLDRTRLSIIQLSNGDIDKLRYYVAAAKKDFRDVIYWASQEE